MKRIFLLVIVISIFISCSTNSSQSTASAGNAKDTLSYAYTALYSSDLTVPSHPEYAQKVLTVWKMYENKQIDSMRQYYADTVTYDDAQGNHYYGPSSGLLDVAKKEMEKLDSLRFDIDMWESVHSNDKNEDWVNIWCKERAYPKGGKADTSLMFEKWVIKDGKISYFNQYYAKMPKK